MHRGTWGAHRRATDPGGGLLCEGLGQEEQDGASGKGETCFVKMRSSLL